jgi:hypothetical protein
MSTSADAERELFRQSVNCAAVLERMVGGWKLDVRESTRRALKYRRGEGEIIIVNHDGRGWWDATGSAKGDVFNLVQHLDPSLNFGAVRKVLRGFVGMAPTYPAASRRQKSDSDKQERPPAERWAERPPLRRGDPAWTYLAEERAIPAEVLNAAAKQDCVRRSAYGSAWFAHRRDGVVTQVEIRNRTYKGSLRGGLKTLFQFGDADDQARRIAVLEAPIDALSLAVIERVRSDTLYVSTGGGMGPGTLDALQTALVRRRAVDGVVVSAAGANTAGDRYAARHAELAAAAAEVRPLLSRQHERQRRQPPHRRRDAWRSDVPPEHGNRGVPVLPLAAGTGAQCSCRGREGGGAREEHPREPGQTLHRQDLALPGRPVSVDRGGARQRYPPEATESAAASAAPSGPPSPGTK